MRRKTSAAFDLKGARESRKLSQFAVAEILCSTQASVSRWEATGNLPDAFRKLWDLHWKVEDSDTPKKSRKPKKS